MLLTVKTIKDNGSVAVLFNGVTIQTTAKTHAKALSLVAKEEGFSNPILLGKTSTKYFWQVTVKYHN